MSTSLPTLLGGRFRLEEQVGIGGMARVYRAFDTLLERPVAIKVLNAEVATSDVDQLERFRREARAVARLSHPHVVGVIDAGEDDGTPFIVFEYVEGETLKQRIRRDGRLAVPEAVAYAIELARALSAAHEHAIVHRDVKPQNVMIDGEGTAKITDFGIARTMTEQGLTVDGRVLGTTDYASPEQALGHEVGGQSDLYSLGIVLYEMLVGDVPFHAESPIAVAMAHVREEVPDVRASRPEVSAALAAIVDRATAKDLRRRYMDAQSMIQDLEEALAIEASRSGQATGEVTAVLRTLPRSARRRLPLRVRDPRLAGAAVGAALLAAAAIAGFAFLHTHRGNSPGVNITSPGTETAVPLRQTAASSYNPYGTGPEHPSTVGLAIDGDPSTYWSTEHYLNGNLAKPGVGLYVDASPGLAARAVALQTPTPGFDVQVLGSNSILHRGDGSLALTIQDRGWTSLGSQNAVASTQRIPIDTAGQRFRYYLVWITKMPPGKENADIAELALYR